MGNFLFLDKQFKEIEETKGFIEDYTDKWGAAEGRSGGAARISLDYVKKAWEKNEERPRVGFYTDVGFEDRGTLIAISGGGKTREVLDAVKNGRFEKILVFTSNQENPLMDRQPS
jgi:fructoselysine-6-P-deglycase FrlB-like protein